MTKGLKCNIIGRNSVHALVVLAMIVVPVLNGCFSIMKAKQDKFTPKLESKHGQDIKVASSSQELIKPKIPEDQEYWPKQSATMNSDNGNQRFWEDQKVRVAALREARTIPTVTKVKICYRTEMSEWWVNLYDDAGSEIDIKTYIWNPDEEKLERFLVLNTIPKSRLRIELAKQGPQDACELLDPNANR